jgi:RhtB (resistance to homoserine/threonine) family protein
VDLGAFFLVSVAVIVVPGVDMALVTRQVLLHGRKAGVVTVAGLVNGGLIHTAAAVLGLSALLAASATAFTVLKYVGAAYLLWLGLSSLWAARRARLEPEVEPAPVSLERAYRTALLTNLTNPKVVVFFLTFLPQFVDPDRPVGPQTALLAVLFMAMATAWLLGFVLLLGRVRVWLQRPSVRRRIEQVSGVVLVGMGLRLVTEH